VRKWNVEVYHLAKAEVCQWELISLPRELAEQKAEEAIDEYEAETGRSLGDFMKAYVRFHSGQSDEPVSSTFLVEKLVRANYYKKLDHGKYMNKEVTDMQAGWNNDPCTSQGIKMQKAASCVHKVPIGCEPKHGCPDRTGERLTPRSPSSIIAEEVLAQAIIKRYCNNCKELELYRGVRGTPPTDSDEVSIPVRPLSSWTLDPNWARRRAMDTQGFVVKKKIPVKRIVAFSPVSGFLSGPELETVVLSEDSVETIKKIDVVEIV
jgi:hypothetical protein